MKRPPCYYLSTSAMKPGDEVDVGNDRPQEKILQEYIRGGNDRPRTKFLNVYAVLLRRSLPQ